MTYTVMKIVERDEDRESNKDMEREREKASIE